MRTIAFVGIKRSFKDLPVDVTTFVRFHLELPFYFVRGEGDLGIRSVVTTVDCEDDDVFSGAHGDTWTQLIHEPDLASKSPDVVVHWRSWQQWARDACPDALHIIQTCDHSYSLEWRDAVTEAYFNGSLAGIICFETWHVRRLREELQLPWSTFITSVHLGVDTGIYRPAEKDPFQLLWASDPGRGLSRCLDVFAALFKRDNRYRLHVTYPDYVQERPAVSHPGVKIHHNLRNGPALWRLFNESMFVPYPSVFAEPSSRVHRQGQAAGACVVYPPDAGSPSELIQSGRTGYVIPYDAGEWANHIDLLRDIGAAEEVGRCARMFAVTEDWSVQAQRFRLVCDELIQRRRDGHK